MLRGVYVFGYDCHCNRDTPAILVSSPLEVTEGDWGEVQGAVPLVKPMYRGLARPGEG